MKQKIFIFLAFLGILSVSIIGYKIHSEATSTKKYGFQPPIDKLYWGMTIDNIEKVLKIQNGVDGVVYIYDKPTTIIVLKDKIKAFGYNATVSLEVFDEANQPDVDWFPYRSSYLANVYLTYDGIDGERIKDNISKKYKNTGNDWVDLLNNNCTTWLSEDKIKDIKPSNKKKLQDLWNIIDEHESASFNEFKSLYSIKKDENESINKIVLVYSDKGASVSYKGDTALQIYFSKSIEE